MIELTPESGVRMKPKEPYQDLRLRVEAACKTSRILEAEGLSITPTAEDMDEARKLMMEYARSPEEASANVGDKEIAQMSCGSLILAHTILQQFNEVVAKQASEIRNLVTNKLIIETENRDPRIRMKAYEMLGKITEVSLFTERSEVTINMASKAEIEQRLKEKLLRLTKDKEGVYAVDDVVEVTTQHE